MRQRFPVGLSVVLALAFALRIGFALWNERPLRSDEIDFERLAWNLAQSGAYSENGRPTAYRPVGYPAFVAAVYRLAGRHAFAVRAAQALVDTGTVALLFLVGSRRRRSTGWIAAWAWALNPAAILYTALLISETLFAFLLFAFLALFDLGANRTGRSTFLHGALLGVLILVKPLAAAFLIPVLWSFAGPRRLRAAALACGALLIVAPWMLRNARAVGTPALATNLGPNLLIGNHPGATGGYAPNVPSGMLPARGLEKDEDTASRRIALGYILHDPGAFLWRGIRKLAYLASSEGELAVYSFHPDPGDPRTRFREKYRSIPPGIHLALSLPYALTLLLGVLGLAVRRGPLGTAFLAFLLSWLFSCFVFFAGSRFHFPLMPAFTLFAAEAVPGGLEPLRNLGRARWAVVLSAWMFLALVWISEISFMAYS